MLPHRALPLPRAEHAGHPPQLRGLLPLVRGLYPLQVLREFDRLLEARADREQVRLVEHKNYRLNTKIVQVEHKNYRLNTKITGLTQKLQVEHKNYRLNTKLQVDKTKIKG